MAVHRKSPRCLHCGEIIAKAVHKKRDENNIVCGDSFLGWKFKNHNCKEKIKYNKTHPMRVINIKGFNK